MLATLILTGGAFYVGIMAYRATYEKPKLVSLVAQAEQPLPHLAAPLAPVMPIENLGLATATLGLATVGALAYPPLRLAVIPLLLYLTTPDLQRAWQALNHERRISAALPAALIPLICLVNGYYVAPALGFCLLGWQRLFLRKAEATTRAKLTKLFDRTLPLSSALRPKSARNEGADWRASQQSSEPIAVGAGELIPVDGVITAGSALISSQQLPLARDVQLHHVGDSVFAATLVQAGCIHIQMQKTGIQTLAAQLDRLLQQAVEPTSAQPTNLPQAVDDALALPMLTLGAATAALLTPMTAVALLNSQFSPNAAALQRLALLPFLGRAAEAGILIKVGSALAQVAQVDTLLLNATASRQPEAVTVIRALRRHCSGIYLVTTSTHPFTPQRLRELHADGVLVADTDAMQAAAVAQFQQAGRCVCYVGDGVTDMLAMQAATVTISLHCSPEQTADHAQILLLRGDLHSLVTLWTLAAEFNRTQTTALQVTCATGALNLVSVLLLGSGLLTSFLFNTVGTLGSIAQVILPVVNDDPQQVGRWLWQALWQPVEPPPTDEADDAAAQPQPPPARWQLQPT